MPSGAVGRVRCVTCGEPLPADTTESVCPRCAFDGALGISGDRPPGNPDSGAVSRKGGECLASPEIPPLERSFGDYELLEKVGEGGMGVVFKARQKSLDRIVAVKMLRLGRHAGVEFVRRFRAEAVAAASLQHPHIVAIHEVGSHEGQQFFVMDYIAGQSLARFVGNQPLPARQAAQFVREIGEAVQFAHDHGILHRDLKPANVLVDISGQVHVTDFGLARRLEGDSELTLTGQVLGSPHYMPPEQAAGKRGLVSRRTDVYGLGAILYHLLTGRPPFLGTELAHTLQEVLNREPISPRLLNPSVPRDLETICLKCLEKDPTRRYPTVNAAVEELDHFLQDQPITARPVGYWEKVWRWCRRQPVRAGLILTLLTVFLVGALGVLWQWQHADRQRRRAEAGESYALRLAYASDMNSAFQALEAGDRRRTLELLERYLPADESQVSNLKFQIQTDLRQWEWRHLWKRCESEAVSTLTNCNYLVGALALSGNGRWLAISSASNILIWDMVTRQCSDRVPVTAVPGAVDISADGRLVACAEADITELAKDFSTVVFETTTRTIVARFQHPGAWWVSQVALSPDCRVLATVEYAGDKGQARLWSLETKQLLWSLPTAPRSGLARGKLRFLPDGRLLAVGQSDGHLRLIDRTTGEVRTDIPPPTPESYLAALAFTPDGKQVLTGYSEPDTNIYVWSLPTGERTGQLTGHYSSVYSLGFFPDGQTFASASGDGTIRLWDMVGRREIRRWVGQAGEVFALVTLPDGKTLVSGGQDGRVCLWNSDFKRRQDSTRSIAANARDFAFAPTSRQVLTVTRQGWIEVWDTSNLQPVANLAPLGASNLCLAVAFPAGRTWLAAGTEGGWVNVWDITYPAQPQRVASFKAHDGGIAALRFDRHGQVLMSAAFGPGEWVPASPGNFKAWDTSSWRERPEFRVGSQQVAYLPDAHLLTVRRGPVGIDFGVRDLLTGQERLIRTGHKHTLAGLVFSPDGRWLASGSFDGTIKLWEVGPWRCAATLMGSVGDIAFSPDSQRLVAASNPVKLWDLGTGRELGTLASSSVAAAFSPDGNTIAVRDRTGAIQLWHAPPLAEISH